MKNWLKIFFAICICAWPAAEGWAEQLSTPPPEVIGTEPESGGLDVDPGLNELRVTFSRPMLDGSWSWVKETDNSFPVITSKPRFLEDRLTCVVGVKLEPGREYMLWINSEQFQNFMDTDRIPAVPYLWIFETAGQQ